MQVVLTISTIFDLEIPEGSYLSNKLYFTEHILG